MKKLRLQIESLAVESFSTDAVEAQHGTVLAHSGGSCNTANHYTCAQFDTCNAGFTCAGGGSTCDPGVAGCGPNVPATYWLNDDPREETACCTQGCP